MQILLLFKSGWVVCHTTSWSQAPIEFSSWLVLRWVLYDHRLCIYRTKKPLDFRRTWIYFLLFVVRSQVQLIAHLIWLTDWLTTTTTIDRAQTESGSGMNVFKATAHAFKISSSCAKFQFQVYADIRRNWGLWGIRSCQTKGSSLWHGILSSFWFH